MHYLKDEIKRKEGRQRDLDTAIEFSKNLTYARQMEKEEAARALIQQGEQVKTKEGNEHRQRFQSVGPASRQ